VIAVVAAAAGLGLPAIGAVTPETGRLLVITAAVFGVTELVYSGWVRVKHPLATRLPITVRSPIVRKPTDEIVAPLPDPPLGFLDFEAAALGAMDRVRHTLEGMTGESQKVTADMTRYTPRFEAAVNKSAASKIRLSREFAAKLVRHAERLEAREAALRTDSETMATSYLRRLEAFPPQADLTELRAQIVQLRDTTGDTRATSNGYRSSLVGMRENNLERSINEATDRMILAMTRVVSDFDRTVRFANDALAMIDRKTAPVSPSAPPPRKRKRPAVPRS